MRPYYVKLVTLVQLATVACTCTFLFNGPTLALLPGLWLWVEEASHFCDTARCYGQSHQTACCCCNWNTVRATTSIPRPPLPPECLRMFLGDFVDFFIERSGRGNESCPPHPSPSPLFVFLSRQSLLVWPKDRGVWGSGPGPKLGSVVCVVCIMCESCMCRGICVFLLLPRGQLFPEGRVRCQLCHLLSVLERKSEAVFRLRSLARVQGSWHSHHDCTICPCAGARKGYLLCVNGLSWSALSEKDRVGKHIRDSVQYWRGKAESCSGVGRTSV